MNELKTIWLVSTGSYSDYAIHSAWSTKEAAEKMANILKREHYTGSDFFEIEIDKPQEEKAGFMIMLDLTTGENILKDNYGGQYPREACLNDGIPKVRFYNQLWGNEKILKYNGKWCKKKLDYNNAIRYEPLSIISEHYTIEQAYKSAQDFRAQKLAELEGVS